MASRASEQAFGPDRLEAPQEGAESVHLRPAIRVGRRDREGRRAMEESLCAMLLLDGVRRRSGIVAPLFRLSGRAWAAIEAHLPCGRPGKPRVDDR